MTYAAAPWVQVWMASLTVTGSTVSKSGQSGFSLLALLFLIAGLGVAMAALGTMWHTASQREKEQELLFIGNQYRQAIESFWNRSPGDRRLPRSLDELLIDPRFPNTVRHLRRIYPDPMTGKSEWGLVKEADGGISGVYSLSGKMPFKRAGFAAANEAFQDAGSYRDWLFRFDYQKSLPEAKGTSPQKQTPAKNPASPEPSGNRSISQ